MRDGTHTNGIQMQEMSEKEISQQVVGSYSSEQLINEIEQDKMQERKHVTERYDVKGS